MDVADTLREVSVALIKDGKTAFTHRSFDQASTNHPNPIVFELPPNRITSWDLPERYPPFNRRVRAVAMLSPDIIARGFPFVEG
jgi:hypothetical protein